MSDSLVDLAAYEITVLNLAGRLDALNVWHLFHGLLGLNVTHLAPAPAAPDGTHDPTKWEVVVAATGCPTILRGKTKIVWGDETLWLHQKQMHINPPCTRCSSAAHMAKNCAAQGPCREQTVVVVDGPLLDVSEAVADAKAQRPESLNGWLRDMDRQIKERSLMGGEDKPAPPHVPTNSPVSLVPVYTTSALQMARKRFHQRVMMMDRKGVGLTILRRQAFARLPEWLKHQLSFRIKKAVLPTPSTDEDDYEEEMRFFRIVMSRPYIAGAEDEEARYLAAKEMDDDDVEMMGNTTPDPVFGGVVDRAWAAMRAKNHERAADEARAAAQLREEKASSTRALALALAAQQAAEAAVIAEAERAVAEAATKAAETTAKTLAAAAAEAAAKAAEEAAATAMAAQAVADKATADAAAAMEVAAAKVAALNASASKAKSTATKKKHKKKNKAKPESAAGIDTAGGTNAGGEQQGSSLQAALEMEKAAAAANGTPLGETPNPEGVEHRGYTDNEEDEDEDLFEEMEEDLVSVPAKVAEWNNTALVPGASRPAHHRYPLGLKGAKITARSDTKPATTSAVKGGKKHSTSRLTEFLTVAGADGKLVLSTAAKKKNTRTKTSGQLGIDGFFSSRTEGLPQFQPAAQPVPVVDFDPKQFIGDGTVAFMGVKPAPMDDTVPTSWKVKKQQLEVRETSTLTNGHCFASAVVGITYGTRPPNLMSKKMIDEATHHHEAICEFLIDYFEHLATDHVIDAAKRFEDYTGATEVTPETLELVLDELERRRSIDCTTTLPRRFWAGPEEIRVACLWLRRPLIVFDVMPDGRAYAVVYVVCQTVTSGEVMRETVDEHAMSFSEARTLLADFKKARVIPYVFALHHTAVNGVATGHFSALRVSDSRYVRSTSTPAQSAAMLVRLDALLRSRGWYPTGTRPSYYEEGTRVTKSRLMPPTASAASGSLYTPSEIGSTGDTATVTATPSATTGSDAADGTPLFPASLVTPISPLADGDYMRLLRQLSRPGPIRVEDEPSLKKALRENKAALADWRRSILKTRPAIADVVAKSSSVEEACMFLIGDPELLLSLLQRIPYIPVLAGRTCKTLFTKIGRALIALGRRHLFTQLAADKTIPKKARQHCTEWLLALAGLPDAAARWQMAQAADRWDRLRLLMKSAKLPDRAISGLQDEHWGALIVHLLVSPSTLREQLRCMPLSTACDTLLRWTADCDRATAAIAASTALQQGLWIAPTEFLDEIIRLSQGQQLVPVTAVATSGALRI